MHELVAADIAQTGAIGAVTVMLAGLFGVFIKAMGDAAKRSDASAEARVLAAGKERDAAIQDALYWRGMYMNTLPRPEATEQPDDT